MKLKTKGNFNTPLSEIPQRTAQMNGKYRCTQIIAKRLSLTPRTTQISKQSRILWLLSLQKFDVKVGVPFSVDEAKTPSPLVKATGTDCSPQGRRQLARLLAFFEWIRDRFVMLQRSPYQGHIKNNVLR